MKDQKIYFVTGKGGVGKSTLALALANQLANAGQKTLLIELIDKSYFQQSLSLPEVSYKRLLIKENLYLSKWNALDCLKEYFGFLIHNQTLAALFFKSSAMNAIIETAPAIQQLAILGKITSGIRKIGPSLDYDCLVVDAFSSGHFKSLLMAPEGIQKAIPLGPIAEQSEQIVKVMSNPQQTKIIIATLPEEVPLVECKEQVQDIHNIIHQTPEVWINKLEPHIEDPTGHPLVQYLNKKSKSQHEALTGQFAKSRKLPMLYETNVWEMIQILSKGLADEK